MGASFLQSTEWEEIQRLAGRKTWRVAGALVIQHTIFKGLHYLYSPRPAPDDPEIFLKEGQEIARREGSVFFKIDPPQEFGYAGRDDLRISESIQPRQTLMSDIQKPDDILLGLMHEKMRYNIRLAERKGVAVTNETNNSGAREIFLELLSETAERDRFNTHERRYYETLIGVRSGTFSNELFFAKFEGTVCAAALINFYAGTATYLHGASSREHRDVMAPHLLHWHIIQEARRRRCTIYDWWGIDEKRFPGVTRFKRGFGGKEIEFPASVDIVYRPFWYHLYTHARRFKF